MKQNKLRCAVVGVGQLGKYHAEKYAMLQQQGEGVELVAVADIDEQVGKEIAQKFNCDYYRDCRELIGKCDLASVVVPSYLHYQVGKRLLAAGVHCLIEKPFATDLAQAEEMQQLAQEQKLMLSIGHLERFNPVFRQVKELCPNPRYIFTERLTEHHSRSMDINVVLDLMIHDLDLVLQLVGSPVKNVNCIGVNVVSKYTDTANAYITFANGAIANVNVSRISLVASRKLRIFQPDLYVSADLQHKNYATANKSADGKITQEKYDLAGADSDTLMMEIRNCVDAIKSGGQPAVTAASAMETLKVAMEVTRQLKDNFNYD